MSSENDSKSAFEHVTEDVVNARQVSARPRDAATLILVRHYDDGPRLLLGKRNAKHKFMPSKYVFPGGAIDPDDGRVPSASELGATCQTRVKYKTRRTPRAFALAAIRETFEETGLKLGGSFALHSATEKKRVAKLSSSWQLFFEDRAKPDLHRLKFIGRAITPPYRPKRFDARFFMVDTDAVKVNYDRLCDGAELSDLNWFSLSDCTDLEQIDA